MNASLADQAANPNVTFDPEEMARKLQLTGEGVEVTEDGAVRVGKNRFLGRVGHKLSCK